MHTPTNSQKVAEALLNRLYRVMLTATDSGNRKVQLRLLRHLNEVVLTGGENEKVHSKVHTSVVDRGGNY